MLSGAILNIDETKANFRKPLYKVIKGRGTGPRGRHTSPISRVKERLSLRPHGHQRKYSCDLVLVTQEAGAPPSDHRNLEVQVGLNNIVRPTSKQKEQCYK